MIKNIHLIFKTHLDVGFTDLAREVVTQYMTHFIPEALDRAEQLRKRGGETRFVWTTGSWLVHHYLHHAAPADRARLEAAITNGDLSWHALPFTTHSELMDADLFRFGLRIAADLDRRFGRHTIAAKLTDVPGHTRAVVPLLAAAGVRFLHVGVNPGSTPPAVPPLFVWRHPTGAEIIVMYHKGTYGDLMQVPGLDQAIAFAHTIDNIGPQSPNELDQIFATYRRRFPRAEVEASTLDRFAAHLSRIRPTLPVITEEIGDTWIHGVGSDPHKVSAYRCLLRLRQNWLATGRVRDSELDAFHHSLLMIPEHTWGMDLKTHLKDYVHYSPRQLRAVRNRPHFRRFASSWSEQRQYIQRAVGALARADLRKEATRALRQLEPTRPLPRGVRRAPERPRRFSGDRVTLGWDRRGAIIALVDHQTGQRWASPAHPLGLLTYQSFSQKDYDRFYRQYIINKRAARSWAPFDFAKPGIGKAGAISRQWHPQLRRAWIRRRSDRLQLFFDLGWPRLCWQKLGAPRQNRLRVDLLLDRPEISFELSWFDKTANRLPEALWISFCPPVHARNGWRLDKMGETIMPREVIHNGNRHLHAVASGVTYRGPEGCLRVSSPDAPLVAPGTRSLLDFNNRHASTTRGMHFLLWNNVWGTNFPMWYDDDARFSFGLHWRPPE